jgi:DNA-binding MarR family transcriptional regulator
LKDNSFQDTLSYLLVQTIKAHRDYADELLSQIGLYTGQELVLMKLGESDGATQTELAEMFCVQPATMTKKLQRMEQAGWIERHTDAEDARISRVYLKAAGEALLADIDRIWADLEARTIAGLSLEERLLLRRLLMQIHQNLITNPE